MRRWENPSEVLRAIHDAVDDLNANRLPEGVRIVPIHDRTELVANTLRTITRTLTEALIIVVIVLSLMLGSVRAALITAVTIPLSLLFAFVCMHFAGIPANLLSLGAIDFGIIVDGNLVMVQHIVRRLGERDGAPDARQRGRHDSASGDRNAAAGLLLAGHHHRRVSAAVHARARGAPAVYADGVHGLLCAARRPDSRAHRWSRCSRRGSSAMGRARGATRCSSGCSIDTRWRCDGRSRTRAPRHRHGLRARGAGASRSPERVGTEFLPQLDEGVIWIRSNLPPGISLEESAETAARMRQLIRQSPEVKMVMSQSGRNDSGMDPVRPQSERVPDRASSVFRLALREDQARSRAGAVAAAQRPHSRAPPSTSRSRSSTPPRRSRPVRPPISRSSSPARISSVLRRLAGEVLDVIRTVPGAADTSIEQEADQSQLRIAVDRAVLGPLRPQHQ